MKRLAVLALVLIAVVTFLTVGAMADEKQPAPAKQKPEQCDPAKATSKSAGSKSPPTTDIERPAIAVGRFPLFPIRR